MLKGMILLFLRHPDVQSNVWATPRYDRLEQVCGYAISLYGDNRNSTDALRITLALALKKQNKWDAAIQVLHDIQDPSLTPLRDDQLPKYTQERDTYLASLKTTRPQ